MTLFSSLSSQQCFLGKPFFHFPALILFCLNPDRFIDGPQAEFDVMLTGQAWFIGLIHLQAASMGPKEKTLV